MANKETLTFQYHQEIVEKFPEVCGGVILGRGLQNGPTPKPLLDSYITEQQAVLTQIGDTPLSELPNLAAWRSAFRRFGINPTKYRSAIEALLRRLTKKGDIPSINMLVDLGNLVSIRQRLPVAIFDVQALSGPITVHLAEGSERFTPLFETQVEHPEPGEVIFSDETRLVVARRWCWQQSDESAAKPDTTDVIITTESQHPSGEADVRTALTDLMNLLGEYAGGGLVSGLVGEGNLSFSG